MTSKKQKPSTFPFTSPDLAALAWVPNDRREKNRYTDADTPGLSFYVHPTGAKSWSYRYQFGGKVFNHGIGPWPTKKLAAARSEAARLKELLSNGVNPADADPASGGEKLSPFVADAFAAWREATEPKVSDSTIYARRGMWNNHLLPKWKKRTLVSITAVEANSLVQAFDNKGQTGTAIALKKMIRQFFKWASTKGYYGTNADALMRSPAIAPLDQVVLPETDQRVVGMKEDKQGELQEYTGELLVLWKACDEFLEAGEAFANLPKLLLLTGQRNNEVRSMPIDEYDPETGKWRVGGLRNVKTYKPHTMPLGQLGQTIMKQQIKLAAEGNRGRGYWRTFKIRDRKTKRVIRVDTLPVLFPNHLGDWKARLDKRMAEIAKAEGITMKPWRFHDLRRTLRTFAGAQENVSFETAELLINHVSGKLERTYDRADKREAKGEAIVKYERFLAPVVGANIMPFAGRSAA